MSKDEYLITDAPLKALTVFAMPMILGSFFQQVVTRPCLKTSEAPGTSVIRAAIIPPVQDSAVKRKIKNEKRKDSRSADGYDRSNIIWKSCSR